MPWVYFENRKQKHDKGRKERKKERKKIIIIIINSHRHQGKNKQTQKYNLFRKIKQKKKKKNSIKSKIPPTTVTIAKIWVCDQKMGKLCDRDLRFWQTCIASWLMVFPFLKVIW